MNVPAWMSGQDNGDAREAPEQPAEPVAHPSQEPEPAEPVAHPSQEPEPAESVAHPPQEPEPAEPPVAPPSPTGTLARAPVPPPSPAGHREPPPLVSTTGGRLTLSFNHVSCVVVTVGLVLLLAGAFALGRADRRGKEPVTTENGTEKTEAGLGDKVSPPPVRQRESGKYYMIIQRLGPVSESARKEGERIVDFCKKWGEQATVELFENPRTKKEFLAVWSLTPFDSLTGESNDAHAKLIEGMGKEYFAKHGNHRFQQRLREDSPLAPTFVQVE